MIKKSLLLSTFICTFAGNAATIALPSLQESTDAIEELMELPKELTDTATAKLGTCIPAVNATHKGQIACTVAFNIGAGSTETQVDFYRNHDNQWVAEPSSSQGQLPFPDPKLQ